MTVLSLLPQPIGLRFPEVRVGDVGVYIPSIFRKYYYKLTLFSNAYLSHVYDGDESVCRLSVKRVRL